MPKRREPPDEEIAILAAELSNLWRHGEALRPWLRRHRQMILDLVHDDLSWDAMAKVFSKAGIKYRAGKGKDWHAEGLRREFVRAAKSLKRDKNPANVIDREATTLVNKPSDSIQHAAPDMTHSSGFVNPYTQHSIFAANAHTFSPAPVFKVFSLKTQEIKFETAPIENNEMDIIQRRMFGE